MLLSLLSLLSLIYNFVKITLYSGLGFGILGLCFGTTLELVEAMVEIKAMINNLLFTQYNLHFIDCFNYFIKYIFDSCYSIIWFGFVFFIIGLLLPLIILNLIILYFINKYNQYFPK